MQAVMDHLRWITFLLGESGDISGAEGTKLKTLLRVSVALGPKITQHH